MSFKVVLILLGAIAIGYFTKLFTTGKKQVILADTVAEIHPLKKHKRKHRIKNPQPQMEAQASVTDADTVVKPTSVTTVKTEAAKAVPLSINAMPVKQVPDSTIHANSFLYTTYIRANVTGIVRLRKLDQYYADIIADIPANAKVQVLKKGEMYYQVAYNNNIGFVPKWALQTK